MSFSNMVSFKVNGKLTIDFHPTPPATASPPAAAPGAPPATPPAAPPGNLSAQDLWDKEKVLETVRQSLEDRQAEENQKLHDAVENLYMGLQQHLQDLEDRIDREYQCAARKRLRNN